jgi:hypothetical protein
MECEAVGGARELEGRVVGRRAGGWRRWKRGVVDHGEGGGVMVKICDPLTNETHMSYENI